MRWPGSTCGAGRRRGGDDEYPASEQADLCQVIAWLAAQPWSTGSVGMYGTSGWARERAAAFRPEMNRDVGSALLLDVGPQDVQWSTSERACEVRP
jgi:hypothetical protein